MELILFSILLAPSALMALSPNQSFWLDTDVIRDQEPHHLLVKRVALKKAKWPEGVVPYTVGSNLGSIQGYIKEVAKEYAEKTCIRFVPKMPSEQHYVQFVRDDSVCAVAKFCRSGGAQSIRLGRNCMDYKQVGHELGHAICLGNEHQRPDRDDYLKVNCRYDAKYSSDYTTLGLMYDYMSIMHYSHCHNGCMKPKLAGVTDCGGKKLSVLDAEKINSLYDCGGCHGYRFRPYNSNPSEVFIAGVDSDGSQLGVCRAYVQGDIIPGKTRGSKCYIPYGGSEHVVGGKFEVMTRVDGKLFRWHSMHKGQAVPKNAIAGGRDKHGDPKYFARCTARHHDKDTTVPGKIHRGRMYYAYGGKEYECTHFQVLQCLSSCEVKSLMMEEKIKRLRG